MKCFAVVLLLAIAAQARQLPAQETTALGYLKNIGIPEAERIREAEAQNRIAGGSTSFEGQFPWQAGLLIDIVGLEGNGVCGAALVKPSRLTTAAHCWYDGQSQAWRFTVVLGSKYLFSGGERIETSAVITHPNWFPFLVRNDVAVIYLATPVDYTPYVSPIGLPDGPLTDELFSGETAVVSGFGARGHDVPISVNQELSYVSVNVISNTICRFSFPLYITDENICTSGAGGTSPCGGDSGGPLYVTRNGEHIMIGMVSFGSAEGCQSGTPTVYARTTEFLDFFQIHF